MRTQLPTQGGRAAAQPRYLVLPSHTTLAVPDVLLNPHQPYALRPVRVVQDSTRDSEEAEAAALRGFALFNRRNGALERLFVLEGRGGLLEWTVANTPGRSCLEFPKDVTVGAGVYP